MYRGDFVQAIKAIYDGENFRPQQPIPVKEEYETIIIFTEPLKKRPRLDFIGLFEGKISMSDDFDEPIEEMKEYME
jgi:hypothetical protein